MYHRSGPVNILSPQATGQDLWILREKTFISKYQKCDRSGPVELREKMLEYIKCATEMNILRKFFLFLNIKSVDRSGPVELNKSFFVKKMLEYIKCATGPDLWIFWEKTFIFKYQKCDRSGPVELREKMLEYIKCATGPPQVRTCEYFLKKLLFSKYQKCRQVRTCGITWNVPNAREKKYICQGQKCDRSGPVWIYVRKMLLLSLNIKCATGPDLWIFCEKTFIFKYQKFAWSGPVEQVRTALLWNYVQKC